MKNIHEEIFSANLIKELIEEYGNDQDLGCKWRYICIKNGKLDELCLQYPNDSDLGNFLRKKFKNNLENKN